MAMQRLGRGEWITRSEFQFRLLRWYRESDEAVIGDPDAHPLTAWVWIRDGHHLAKLCADTTRAAVAAYILLLRGHHGELEWSVIPSARGQPTKIAFGADRTTIEGFHLYVDPTTVPRRERPGS
ncbi:MAG: hypothetical protein ACRELX_01340 [Longimicrobiales bacterium]